MGIESIISELTLIIVGAAVLGTIFLYARQPIIIAYIVIGVIVGPSGLGLMPETSHIEHASHVGVILLLFLIGLNLQPEKLLKLFKKTAGLTLGTAFVFAITGFGFALLLRRPLGEALIFGLAMMFSSTVVGLKLIPTTALHHKHTGEMMTSILLIQDILAILVILFVGGEQGEHVILTFSLLSAKFVVLCVTAFAGVKYVVTPLLTKFDTIQEYTFVATLGWCMVWAVVAHAVGLSYEMGAFLAGISIASCRAATAIAEHLKPLREFFLILFFFSMGAKLNIRLNPALMIPAILFGVALVPLKAVVYRFGFQRGAEPEKIRKELAVRLSQASEFSLLLAFSAASAGAISDDTAMMIQIATIISFSVSTYWVVLRYPTPIS
jgi:Kef-type K+ transport system membrane component KefB